MSLIKIRGRTILGPILTEEERNEARAFREKAILYQQRLEQERSLELQHCNYQCQQQQQLLQHHHHQQQSNIGYHQQNRTTAVLTPAGPSHSRSAHDNDRGSKKSSKSYNKNETKSLFPLGIKNRSCGETSSSSAPSSQGSGGELTEDSPSAANVSVQTESSGSVTTSTDLHHYLNNSLDTSLDTSISVSHDIWHNSPSLVEVDEALLQSESTEVATNLILGRLHPSVILKSTSKPITSRQESQNTETSSTLVQGHTSSGKHTMSESHDMTTMASVSLSFASVSEEGSEEGIEAEVSEELLDISEEDKDTSFPSELDSDAQRYDQDDSCSKTKLSRKSMSGTDTDEGFQSTKENWKENVMGQQQRDSGRGTSHSDYLDNYLELLTSRSGSSHGVHPTTVSVSKCGSTSLATTYAAMAGRLSTRVKETFPQRSIASVSAVKPVTKQRLVCSEENLEKICPISKEILQKDLAMKKTKLEIGKVEKKNTECKEDDSITDEIKAFDNLDDWPKDLILKPRAASATPERKERKRTRSRRWSSCQPLDPRRSVGSKYLDSYLGKLTDDAWLQYPTQLCDRRMVYLSSDEYINAVRPKASNKLLDQHFTSTDMSENSASEETKNFHTSTESLHSSIMDGVVKESSSDRNSGFSLVEESAAEQEAIESDNRSNQDIRSYDNISSSPGSYVTFSDISEELDRTDQISSSEPVSIAHSRSGYVTEDTEVCIQPVGDSRLVKKCLEDKSSLKTKAHTPLERAGAIYKDSKDLDEGKANTDTNNSSVKDNGRKESEILSLEAVSNRDQQNQMEADMSSECLLNSLQELDALQMKNWESHSMRLECRSGEVTRASETADEGGGSSSDDSSETEPSTIVYVEDIPLESPGEGKTLLSTDSDDISFLRTERSLSSSFEGSLPSLPGIVNGIKAQRRESAGILEQRETISRPSSEGSNLTNHSMKLVTSQKMEKFKSDKLPTTSNDSTSRTENEKQRMFEYDISESEEECLVVQVIVDENGTPDTTKSFCDIAKLETKKKKELIKENLVRNVSTTVANIADSEMELAERSPTEGWEVPEQGPKDAMGQVLSLIKAKQQQELEELRHRQEAEIHQVFEKLQKVSPQKLHAFLNSSNEDEAYIDPKSRNEDDSHAYKNQGSHLSVSSQGISNGADDTQVYSEKLEVKKTVRSVSPAKIAKAVSPARIVKPVSPAMIVKPASPARLGKPSSPARIVKPVSPARVVRPISPARNIESRKKNFISESNKRIVRNDHDSESQPMVPCNAYPSATREERGWSPHHHGPHTDFISDRSAHLSSCPVVSLSDYSTCHSSVTYPTSSLPLISENSFSSANVSVVADHSSSIDRPLPESPKPRPSNHINIMPSYFMYEESRMCSEVGKNDLYRAHITEQNSSFVESITRPQGIPQMTSSLGSTDNIVVCCSAHLRNNNPETVDTLSYINGNCLSYGDGMQYYRLFSPEEESNMMTKSTSSDTQTVPPYHPQTTETVVQPGLFRVIGNSPRPTSITSLLKEHPEMFGEEVLEVNLEHGGEWSSAEAEFRERCHHSASHEVGAYHSIPASTTSVAAEGGLDMVPEKESAATPAHRLGQDSVFIMGIIRLQACVRRYLTQRLLRTKFVQEQLSTLSEIAKLAQQFHRDILTDNIQKGDVDFHKTLYNQERIARDRIRKVFVVLSVEEQMSLIRRDHQILQLQHEKKRIPNPKVSPVHTKTKNRYQEERQKPTVSAKVSTKRPSPPGSKNQQERKTRGSTSASKATSLAQPTVLQTHSHTKSTIRPDYRLSPRGSRLPVHVSRSSSNLESSPHSHHPRTSRSTRSPSQDSQSPAQTTGQSGSQPPRSSSTSRLCTQRNAQSSPRITGPVTNTRTCTIRSATNRVTPPRAPTKSSLVNRKPWR